MIGCAHVVETHENLSRPCTQQIQKINYTLIIRYKIGGFIIFASLLEGGIGDMDFSTFSVALCSTGNINGITKETITWHPAPNNACSDHATVDPNTNL